MAIRPRKTRPQNIGANRNRSMRNNAAVQQNRGTFQSGLSRNQGVTPPGAGQRPGQGMKQCPPGQQPGRDPNTGAQTCMPARQQPNISSQVPVGSIQKLESFVSENLESKQILFAYSPNFAYHQLGQPFSVAFVH